MSLSRQAKIILPKQERAIILYLAQTRYPLRNKTIFLLSIKAGLRAKEISALTWRMCIDSGGNIDDFLRLEDAASKGRSGRAIPLNKELMDSLINLYATKDWKADDKVIRSERGGRFSAQAMVNFFYKLYADIGLIGCSSHSGRRTFVTRLAKNITQVHGSLHDVQRLAGHSSLKSTQMYIEHDEEAAKNVINLI